MSLYRREVLSVVGQAFFWVTFRLAKVQKIESHFSSRLGLQWEMPGKLAVHVYHTQQVPVASLRIFHDFGDVPAPLNKVKTNAYACWFHTMIIFLSTMIGRRGTFAAGARARL